METALAAMNILAGLTEFRPGFPALGITGE
jgi:hypothetical protein